MGRGGNTNQTGVDRHKPTYSSDIAAVGGGSGLAPEMAETCIFGFTEEVPLDGPSARGAKADLPIMLVAGVPGTINIMSGGARLGVYDGDHKTQILRCMRKKYIYQGKVESTRTVDSTIYATCKLQGMGRLR